MKQIILFLLALALCGCISVIPVSTTPSASPSSTALLISTSSATGLAISADVLWLKANAIPFDTTDPDSNLEDLMPLKGVIGSARIVALGEATHGTHEFFQMKHRMLEFLVEEMGFNIFAMEANWPEANLINDYIHTGMGDPTTLLKGLYFWTWDTQEVLDMIRWMRAYNENPSNTSKISFFGFDMQYDQMARDTVAQYIQKVDPKAVKQIADDFSCSPTTSTDCQTKLQDVYDSLSQHQANYTVKSSTAEFVEALHSARLVIEYEDFVSHNNDSTIRDRYMAENITWLLDQAGPSAKIVLWAHNYHVGMSGDGQAGGDEISQTMGDYLRKQYGNQMVVFGFLFYQGLFNAIGEGDRLQTFGVLPPTINSYEYYFHEADLPRFFLDLRPVRSGSPAADWLLTPHPFHDIGAMYSPYDAQLSIENESLAKVFDVAIYFQDTSPSILLMN